ncbi:hypothetical protein [Anaerorhabdus sp.]|uniref:hypothetical protein n=1 Tax=Anaerorhabdus sp. TaxID=1872524 RepID=UPI002FC7F0BF
MKQIKKILFRNTKISMIVMIASLIAMIAFFFLFGLVNDDGMYTWLILLIVIGGYAFLMGLIFWIINFYRYSKAMSYFKKRVLSEGIEIDDEQEFEKLNKNVYLSSKIIISTYMVSQFVLYKSWVKECNETEKFQNGRYWPCVVIKTDDKTFTFLLGKEKLRVELMEALKTAFVTNDVIMSTPIMQSERELNQSGVDFADKSNGMNIIVFGLICLAIVAGFGFSYPYLRDMIHTKSTTTPLPITNNNYDNNDDTYSDVSSIDIYFGDKYYNENDEVNAIYNVVDGVTLLYVTNDTPYAFRGTLEIYFGEEKETIETYWIRPHGYDYFTLNTTGEPTEYRIIEENYKEYLVPSLVKYTMMESYLTNSYAYDIVFDEAEINEDNVIDVSLEQARLTELEEYPSATLFFHEMDLEEFETMGAPEDFSTVRYVVEIDVESKSFVVYATNGEERTEITTVNY